MLIGDWLQRLGLAQYEATFLDHHIDSELLTSLTAEDLKDLGVTSVGHRRKLLDAISALRDGVLPQGLRLSDGDDQSCGSEKIVSVQAEAERRQVTVMFFDLVGSTALSGSMDAEDLREVVSAYHKCVAEIVQRFDGYVAQYMGDGVLVYFGYPQAHEDDAERAIRAGLEVIASVTALTVCVPLHTRVGVATGVVVVGDLSGSGEAQERGIVGETPNLAARLQSIAESDSIVLAETTRRLLGDLFELRDLGPQRLKGITRQSRAWVALRPKTVESRFDALHGARFTALVGREEEIETLLRRWYRAKNREGQVVLLSGEPGIGKSRLTVELLNRITTEPCSRLRYFCSPQHANSSLHPIIGQLERAAGFTREDDPRSKVDKLNHLLARTSTSPQDAALFAEMLSLPAEGFCPAFERTAPEQREKTLAALTSQVERLANQQPVLMILEDAHWIDPTSLEVFSRTVERIRSHAVLLVVTFRPDFNAPWAGESNVTLLTLSRLEQRDSEAIIDQLVGKKSLSQDVMTKIIERTDGIPLFIEEMTKAVLESSDFEAQHTDSVEPSSIQAVPASLHASLMARLDRLRSAKEIAQIGAAIGRQFSHELLAAVALRTNKELEQALARLVKAGLVFRRGSPPHASYIFKHALVRDAAYSTLLREPRRALHASIARALDEKFPEIQEAHPETLAHHYTEAGLIEKAANLWGKAGQKSISRSALLEAVTHLTKALDLMATLPETPALQREQMNTQVELAATLMHVKGFAAPETIAALDEANSRISQVEPPHGQLEDCLLRFSVLAGLWSTKFVAFDGDAALARAQEVLTLAEHTDSAAALLLGTRLVGTTLVLLGQFEAARTQLDRSMAVYVPEEHRRLRFRFNQVEPGVASLVYHSLAMWLLGYPDAAMSEVETAVQNARHLNHASTLMYVLFHVCMPEILSGKIAAAEAHGQELLSLADEKVAPLWRAHGIIIRGRSLSMRERAAEGTKIIETGINAFESTGATHFKPIFLAELGRAYGQCGELEKAKNYISQALKAAEKTKERWAEAEIHRTAGELLLGSDNLHDAEVHFTRSLSLAREQHAKSWELRTATSLARLWHDQGRRSQALDLLAPLYGWFTEGFDTADLMRAKLLLDELY